MMPRLHLANREPGIFPSRSGSTKRREPASIPGSQPTNHAQRRLQRPWRTCRANCAANSRRARRRGRAPSFRLRDRGRSSSFHGSHRARQEMNCGWPGARRKPRSVRRLVRRCSSRRRCCRTRRRVRLGKVRPSATVDRQVRRSSPKYQSRTSLPDCFVSFRQALSLATISRADLPSRSLETSLSAQYKATHFTLPASPRDCAACRDR